MPSECRYVFDTNALVSAVILPRSVSRRAFDRAFAEGTLLASPATVEELAGVLRRPVFDRYVSAEARTAFVSQFICDAEHMDARCDVRECRDPDDNKFLSLAVSGGASFIVTGDRDLLELHPFRGIDILTPRQFLDLPLWGPGTMADT